MKIRQASRFDIPRLIELMKHYREQSPLACLKQSNNETYVESVLYHITLGKGVIYVAEHEGLVVGMIVAIKNQNIWDPEIYTYNELAYWVEPEHRGTSAGFKLLKRYQEAAEQAKVLGTIKYYTITKMINSPDLSYDRFGFRKLEEMWEQ
jgi:N-acetylglutamate synthase-like GNAT family acetyltransferase